MKIHPRISAVVNTLNEERDLRGCLATLTWCDEIVVVDMHSDDDTVSIAREFTDKVFLHERIGFVEPARIFAVDRTHGEWVLIVDADEMIPRPLAQELRRIAKRDDADVVKIPRRNFLLGEWIKNTGWWPDVQARFFKRGAIQLSQEIHAPLAPAADARVAELSSEEFFILHLSSLDLSDLMSKVDAYTTVEARQMSKTGQNFDWSLALSSALAEFRWRYFEMNGFGDGDRGLILSAVMSFYRFLIWMKLWELEHNCAPRERYAQLREDVLRDWSISEKSGQVAQ